MSKLLRRIILTALAVIMPLLFMFMYHTHMESWDGEKESGYAMGMFFSCLLVMVALLLGAFYDADQPDTTSHR